MFYKMTPKQAMLGGAFTAIIMGGFMVISRFGVRDVFTGADLTLFRYFSGLLLLPVVLRWSHFIGQFGSLAKVYSHS